MKFSARIERGNWANQVRRLIDAYGKGADEVLRSQARLFVRDAMRFTPPFGDEPIRESWGTQRKMGIGAIVDDMKKMMLAASQLRILSAGSPTAHLWKKQLAEEEEPTLRRLQATIKTEKRLLWGVWPEAKVARVEGKMGRGRRYKKAGSYLLYNGEPPPYFAPRGRLDIPPELREIVKRKTKKVGRSKAGWVKAADALGLKGIPAWVRKETGISNGIFSSEGSGLEISYTVGSLVPWMQHKGKELNIIERAWRNRQRNIEKEIENVLRANARKALKGSK